jgi:5-methylcytosine-specific restriction endonuclease McrA
VAGRPGRGSHLAKQQTEDLRRLSALRNSPCCRCGQAIDYSLRWPHPDAFSKEHLRPVSLFPHLAEDPENLAPSHWRCNASAGNRQNAPALGVTGQEW